MSGSADGQISGSLRSLFFFDVAESIDLTSVHSLLGSRPRREPAFRHPSPEYVRFERPPVTQSLGQRCLASGDAVEARIRYFDYGVVSVELLTPFRGCWRELAAFAHARTTSSQVEPFAKALAQEALQQTGAALINRYEPWLSEDYCIVQVDPIKSDAGETTTAEELIRSRSPEIAKIVRGELVPLSPRERDEVLRASMSYYATDLLVVGWVVAFIYDTPDGAEPTVELLEYANTQLLEFRYYDEVLTRLLRDVYKQLENSNSLWRRWAAGRDAEMLNTIRLDYQELVERTDNAIKFLSDMFYARMYKLAANRIGADDYLALVNEKLITARDLYESMVNAFHQARAFVLELTVVVILTVEIVLALIRR